MNGNKYKILIIEDDEHINNLVATLLEANGYQTLSAYSCEDGMMMYASHRPDLVVLDLGLPDQDGMTFLKRLRKDSLTPVIVLSARSDEKDKVEALDMGANDYVTKPFGMMELISRIKAVLRRSANGSISSEDTFEIGEIRLNPKKHEVTVHGEVVNLTLKEYELLKRLMKNSNIVLTRDQLLEDIWGYDFDGETRTVDVHVRTLRQKLGDAGEQIETVRGVGYRMSR